MLTKDFYNIIDAELSIIIEKYKNDEHIKRHKTAIDNQKSYALLIWFLDFYGRKSNYSDFITDGKSDASCDIVLDNLDSQGNKVFYIIQSKWTNINNSEKETNKDEILKALQDFETILRGGKKNVHEKLKVKLNELDLHLKANGEVKFIFLSLSQYKGGADENIEGFRNNDVKTKFEVIDINRIKVDYIDRKYKKIDPINPLETYQNPEESPITIKIFQKAGSIKIDKPYEAHMFLLRPKAVWELFSTYKFSLFYKNVRNPLLQSQFNADIEKTALENASNFWYYNNGITAITYLLPPIGKKAEEVSLTGLQIINGAQTVYAIYRAYESASPTKRIQMDSEALVTLRLLKSGGKDFDLNVTRYTNSQNPVQDRDFCANDDIQIRLQNDSFKTNFWYEKRRDEFREVPEGVKEIPNIIFANCYLAYHLQDPISVMNNSMQYVETNKDMLFVSHKDDKNGLYEKIFNEDSKFEDFLTSLHLLFIVHNKPVLGFMDTFSTNIYHILSLFKTVFTKYCKLKYSPNINVNLHIQDLYDKNNVEIILKTLNFVSDYIAKEFSTNEVESSVNQEKFSDFMTSASQYERVKGKLEDLEITTDLIEKIELVKRKETKKENLQF